MSTIDSTKKHIDMQILITKNEIQKAVLRIAREMEKSFNTSSSRLPPLMVGALKGSVIFMSDLARSIKSDVEIDFIEVNSYGSGRETSGQVRILKDFSDSLEGRDIILVEDILDTGLTMNFLVEHILSRNAASLQVAALLVKHKKHKFKHNIDYRGFDIDDHFVVGYGMDYGGLYRNLDHIACLPQDEV